MVKNEILDEYMKVINKEIDDLKSRIIKLEGMAEIPTKV